MKILPPEMRDWYFSFNWDVECLWSLDVPVQTLPMSDLRWHFDIPIWSKEGGLNFDLCPVEVLRNPGRYPIHDARIAGADISHPLDLMFSGDRLVIIDGVHRLAKYEKDGIELVQVRIIPREMIPLFAEE
jgi:hypothetical protein